MKQHFWKLFLMIVLALILFFWLIKAPIMSAYLSSKLHVPVSVGRIGIWPSETNMLNFKIMNPRRFHKKDAFKADHVQIGYLLKKLFSEPTEVDHITLKGVYLNIEIPSKSSLDNNWSTIGAKMREEKSSHQLIINTLTLNDITVEVGGAGAKLLGVAGLRHFDQMQFTDIDSRNGFPTKELAQKIFQDAGILQYLENFLQPVKEIENIFSPLKLFSKMDGEGRAQVKLQ